jgi:hypothetical protein
MAPSGPPPKAPTAKGHRAPGLVLYPGPRYCHRLPVKLSCVRWLWVVCELCHHEAVTNFDRCLSASVWYTRHAASSARMRDRIGRSARYEL